MYSFLPQTRLSTFFKYLLSYLIIFTVLILGFFFILKMQITKKYFDARSEQNEIQLDSLAENLKDDIIYLFQFDSAISTNQTINKLCYSEDKIYFYPAREELMQYISTSNLLSSIVYMPKNTQNILSTMLDVTYKDGIFTITDAAGASIDFDAAPYFDGSNGKLVFIQNEHTEFLLYFPKTGSSSNSVFFYIVDLASIQSDFKSLISSETPAIALVDGDGNIVTGIHTEMLVPYINELSLSQGIFKQDSTNSICVSTEINNGFAIVSILSNNLLTEQVNDSFANTYLTLLLLSLIAFILIFMTMKFTYWPLHQLAQTVLPNFNAKQNYIHQLHQAFSDTEERNLKMQEKLNNYRISIQKSLLDSVLMPQYAKVSALPNIDQFFDSNLQNREIFIIKTTHVEKPASFYDVMAFFNEALPGNDSCILLESSEEAAVFLINFTGEASDKNKDLTDLCYKLYNEKGYLFAVSNGSDTPLDIPSLYENVTRISTNWPQIPVADYHSLPSAQTTFIYPHDDLELLSKSLSVNDFPVARKLVSDIFNGLNPYSARKNPFPAFFVTCILIDMLTIIANNMSLAYIDFHSYSDVYYNILYLCRSFPYAEKEEEITLHTRELLDFYEKSVMDKQLHIAPIKQLMQENYCDPAFSISVLAEQYHISVSRMSVLFKNELNIGFSDYLWLLRLDKAKELLTTSDMSIDEISIAVGYLNTSSFRRKFKQETGLSPSQFRAECSE